MDILKQYECIHIGEICRICLIKKTGMIVLRESGIENIIISCTSIKILEEDRSHFICLDCINKVQSWYDFFQRITQSFKIGHLAIEGIINQKQNKTSSATIDTDTCFHNTTENQENPLINLSFQNSSKSENTLGLAENEHQIFNKEYKDNVEQDFYGNIQFENIITHLNFKDGAIKENRNFECEKCGKTFKQVQTLNDHVKRHYNLRNFACSLCGKTFYKQFNVLEHMRIHTGERPFRCEFCVKTFTRTLLLRNHIKKVHIDDKRFVCEVCKKSFVDNYQLKIHMRTHTGEKPYKCVECEKAFALQGQLNSHVKYKHTKQKDFICNICARAFTAKYSLEEHLRVHSGLRREPKHQCLFCEKKCITTTQLKVHINSQHTGERPFPCQICLKSFITKSALDCHSRTHIGEKSYFCGECGKAFSTNSTLKIHLKIHTGEKPFKCEQCCKRFAQGSTLKAHVNIHKCENYT